MTDRQLSLKDLLQLLPQLPEFAGLRNALMHASSQDDVRRWTGASTYATIDRRLISSALVDQTLEASEAAMKQRAKSLHAAADIAFSALGTADAIEKIDQLVGLGEAAAAVDSWRDAVAYFALAEALATMTDDSAARILTRRRLGYAHLNTGNFRDANHYFTKSLADASACGDDLGQIKAAIALGNAAGYAGRWPDADGWYGRALTACGNRHNDLRIELMINRAHTARERGLLQDAERWLTHAHELWAEMPQLIRAAWYNGRGLVHLTRMELNEAEAALLDGMEAAVGHFMLAMILDNLAEVAIQRGDFDLALDRARAAEEYALAHGSPRGLAEVYMRLGRWCSLQNDSNGVPFFEKAVDLVRDGQFPMLLANIYREYAQFRLRLRDPAAAKSLLTQSLAIYLELGAHEQAKDVELSLTGL